MNPRGFALLAALWLLTGVGAVVMAGNLATRESVQASVNRISSKRAAWAAEGCFERLRSRLDQLVAGRVPWESLGTRVATEYVEAFGCHADLRPAGFALDVNTANRERLHALLTAAGLGTSAVDSMTDALLDWRDLDDESRPFGAEKDWYRSNHRPEPRNGPLAATAELRLIRGFDRDSWDSLLDVESGRTPVNLAPPSVVGSLPGMTSELRYQLTDRRRQRRPITTLWQLAEGASRAARDSLSARMSELAAEATIEPEAWVLSVSANGLPARISATIDVRLSQAANRVAIVRKRVR